MYSFDAPIPGESLTKMPGGSAMEHPPQFTDLEDALEYVWKRFTSPKHSLNVVLLLKKGMTVEYIVNTIMFQGVAQGKWSVDLALLMYQVVFWQVEAIAKLKKINYKGKSPDVKQNEFLSNFVDLLEEPREASVPLSIFKGIS